MHPENDTPSPPSAVEHTTAPTRRIPRQTGHHSNDTSTMWHVDEQEDTHLVRGYD
ncbi:hypothetical protein FHR84_003955 [Actinopolyspora biskrensis]|uniref:Uncharacterized protein n=1 Tax=Actinopolyspora biskrensis TaxID=1470178 RepID=A0A852Z4C2_9ACTN|nr:hypothetical protein [Actinopolyspora biskrensis]NYH80589.1 hypothetical protein [Actinopolyspora biskrensis]